MHRIKEVFDGRFKPWQITIPENDLRNRSRGSIRKNGWIINYLFGSDHGQDYLEYYARHRVTNDTLNRIYTDGLEELVGYCLEFCIAEDESAEREYLKHNQDFYQEVRKKGLN